MPKTQIDGDLILNKTVEEVDLSDALLSTLEPQVGIISETVAPIIKKPEIEYDFGLEETLPRYSNIFYEVTSINGPLALHGFHLDFNSDRVIVRVEIDGQEFFEIDCEDLENNTPSSKDSVQMTTGMWITWLRTGDHFIFKPEYPIKCLSSLTIEVKANSASDKRELTGWQLNYEDLTI